MTTIPAEIELPDLDGTGYSWRRAPVAYHGLSIGIRTYVTPGRLVVDGGDWPAPRPEECTDDSMQGTWLSDDLLVCPGCGLDCT